MELSRVPSFATLVPQQIHQAEAERAQHLWPLCCVRDIHGRVDAACDGLAGLVHALACEEEKFRNDAGGHPGTHSSGEAMTGCIPELQVSQIWFPKWDYQGTKYASVISEASTTATHVLAYGI